MRRSTGAAVIALSLSCNGGKDPAPEPGPSTPPSGSCAVETETPADEGAAHVATCSPVRYASQPPSSGNHYPSWAVFRVYDKPVPWGFLVHALEHGAVVIAYSCPDGCPADLAAARALLTSGEIPARAGCPGPPVIITPDPTLQTPWAASAWHHVLRARCFDHGQFARFILDNENHGPELIDGDCGVTDREATGWCAPAAP